MMEYKRTLAKFTAIVVLLFASAGAHGQLYWRVDLGYSSALDADIEDKNFAVDQLICGDAACNTPGKLKKIGSSPILSIGAGWRFSQNFRGDATIAYRGGYKLDDSDASGPPPTNFKADIKSWNLMANGYWDFPLTWGVPYVGAGLGFASNKVGDVSAEFLPGLIANVPGGTSSGLAWALMTGVGIPISPHLILDIGYRYSDLGKLETDSGNATFSGTVIGTYSGAKGVLRAHELMVGLRF